MGPLLRRRPIRRAGSAARASWSRRCSRCSRTLVPPSHSRRRRTRRRASRTATRPRRAKDWAKAAAEYDAANNAPRRAQTRSKVSRTPIYQRSTTPRPTPPTTSGSRPTARRPRPRRRRPPETRLQELAGRTGPLAIDSAPRPARRSPSTTSRWERRRSRRRSASPPDRIACASRRTASCRSIRCRTSPPAPRPPCRSSSRRRPPRASSRSRRRPASRFASLVDNVDMGDAPWTGEVEAGPARGRRSRRGLRRRAREDHRRARQDAGRRARRLEQRRDVEGRHERRQGPHLPRRQARRRRLVHERRPLGHARARASRARATTRSKRQIELKDKETLARSITLKLSSKIETGPVQAKTRPLEGIYGGFGLLMTFLPGGMKSSMQKTCDAATSPPS